MIGGLALHYSAPPSDMDARLFHWSHRFRAGGRIRGGPQVGKVAT